MNIDQKTHTAGIPIPQYTHTGYPISKRSRFQSSDTVTINMREGAWEGNSHQKDQIEVTSFESTRQSMILGTYT